MSNSKSMLITGGTGTLGSALIRHVREKLDIGTIVVYSRDEFKQANLRRELADCDIRWMIGDIRDGERLKRAMFNIDIVVHAAALKRVGVSEQYPSEFFRTNIDGSSKVLQAASQSQSVNTVIGISTDKACMPINAYGASKMCMERLFTAEEFPGGFRKICVRYGNVYGSRGSIVDILNANSEKVIQIANLEMTRFWITTQQAVDIIVQALLNGNDREIYVPNLPSMSLKQLLIASDICESSLNVTGMVGVGEKIHEDLISPSEAQRSTNAPHGFIIHPERVPSIDQAKSILQGLNSATTIQRLSDSEACEWVSQARSSIRY